MENLKSCFNGSTVGFKALNRNEMKKVLGGRQQTYCNLTGGGTYDCGSELSASSCLEFCLVDYGNQCAGGCGTM